MRLRSTLTPQHTWTGETMGQKLSTYQHLGPLIWNLPLYWRSVLLYSPCFADLIFQGYAMDVQKQRECVYRERLDANPDDWCVNYYYVSRFPPYLSFVSWRKSCLRQDWCLRCRRVEYIFSSPFVNAMSVHSQVFIACFPWRNGHSYLLEVWSYLLLGSCEHKHHHRTWNAILLEKQWKSGMKAIVCKDYFIIFGISYMFAMVISLRERL